MSLVLNIIRFVRQKKNYFVPLLSTYSQLRHPSRLSAFWGAQLAWPPGWRTLLFRGPNCLPQFPGCITPTALTCLQSGAPWGRTWSEAPLSTTLGLGQVQVRGSEKNTAKCNPPVPGVHGGAGTWTHIHLTPGPGSLLSGTHRNNSPEVEAGFERDLPLTSCHTQDSLSLQRLPLPSKVEMESLSREALAVFYLVLLALGLRAGMHRWMIMDANGYVHRHLHMRAPHTYYPGRGVRYVHVWKRKFWFFKRTIIFFKDRDQEKEVLRRVRSLNLTPSGHSGTWASKGSWKI